MTIATATEVKNNFGKYLKLVQEGDEIVIVKNGKEVARIISKKENTTFLTDSLRGILKGDYDLKEIKKERMSKYESNN